MLGRRLSGQPPVDTNAPSPGLSPAPRLLLVWLQVGDEGWLVSGGWGWVRAGGRISAGPGRRPQSGGISSSGQARAWARLATGGSRLCPRRGSLSSRVRSCGASVCLGWAALALQSGPGPWVKLLRPPSGPSLAPQPQIHRSRVSESAPSCGPLPTATPAPLWTHGHGNFGHPTRHLAQHGHPMPWAPPAPTPLGGQVSWAGRLSQLQRRGPRGALARSLPTAPPVALGTGGTWSLRPSSLEGQQTPAGSASHTGWPGHCPQVGVLTPRPAGSWKSSETEGAQLTQPLCTIQPAVHLSASRSRSWRSRQASQS